MTAFAVVYALGAPTLAVVCERLPRRTVMVSALAVIVLANVAAALTPGYWWLMAARTVAVACAAVVTPAASSPRRPWRRPGRRAATCRS
ncbi:MFS transporter [Streptomyces sp. Ac-502]|uniref:MFS transporter n=1 Tax=Streptomyces sp. Ac-502 TaxID=3342801 RepID=UPI0038627D95